jgi:hypothetical protein
MTAGTTGAAHYTSFTQRGRSSELVFESPDADVSTVPFHALRTHRSTMEQAHGQPLNWQERLGRKATRVADYLPDADVSIEENWDHYLNWLVDRQTRLRSALAAVGGVPQP